MQNVPCLKITSSELRRVSPEDRVDTAGNWNMPARHKYSKYVWLITDRKIRDMLWIGNIRYRKDCQRLVGMRNPGWRWIKSTCPGLTRYWERFRIGQGKCQAVQFGSGAMAMNLRFDLRSFRLSPFPEAQQDKIDGGRSARPPTTLPTTCPTGKAITRKCWEKLVLQTNNI